MYLKSLYLTDLQTSGSSGFVSDSNIRLSLDLTLGVKIQFFLTHCHHKREEKPILKSKQIQCCKRGSTVYFVKYIIMYSSSQQTIYLSDRKVKLVCFVNDFHQTNNCTIEKLSDVLFYLFFSSLIQCDLPPLRPHCGEAPPARDSSPGRRSSGRDSNHQTTTTPCQ